MRQCSHCELILFFQQHGTKNPEPESIIRKYCENTCPSLHYPTPREFDNNPLPLILTPPNVKYVQCTMIYYNGEFLILGARFHIRGRGLFRLQVVHDFLCPPYSGWSPEAFPFRSPPETWSNAPSEKHILGDCQRQVSWTIEPQPKILQCEL